MSSYDPFSLFYPENFSQPEPEPQANPYDPLQSFGIGTPVYNPAPSQNPFLPPPPTFDMSVYLPRLRQVESSGNPYAQNPDSSAGGLYQFNDETALDYGLVNRFDTAEATAAAERLTNDRLEMLRKALGREPTYGEVYLAHQQGAKGAIDLLTNPDALAVDVRTKKSILGNKGNESMTAGDFAKMWISKFETGLEAKPADFASVLQAAEDGLREETAAMMPEPAPQQTPLEGPAEGDFMSGLPEALQAAARPGGVDWREGLANAGRSALGFMAGPGGAAVPSLGLPAGMLQQHLGVGEAQAQAMQQQEALAQMKDRKAMEAKARVAVEAFAQQSAQAAEAKIAEYGPMAKSREEWEALYQTAVQEHEAAVDAKAQEMTQEIEQVVGLKSEARAMGAQGPDEPAHPLASLIGPFDALGRLTTGLFTEPYAESRKEAGPQDWSAKGIGQGMLQALGSPFEAIGEMYLGLGSHLPGETGEAATRMYRDLERGMEGQHQGERFGKNLSADLAEGDEPFASMAGTAAEFADTPFDIAGSLWSLGKLGLRGAGKAANVAEDLGQAAAKGADAVPEAADLARAAQEQAMREKVLAAFGGTAPDASPAAKPIDLSQATAHLPAESRARAALESLYGDELSADNAAEIEGSLQRLRVAAGKPGFHEAVEAEVFPQGIGYGRLQTGGSEAAGGELDHASLASLKSVADELLESFGYGRTPGLTSQTAKSTWPEARLRGQESQTIDSVNAARGMDDTAVIQRPAGADDVTQKIDRAFQNDTQEILGRQDQFKSAADLKAATSDTQQLPGQDVTRPFTPDEVKAGAVERMKGLAQQAPEQRPLMERFAEGRGVIEHNGRHFIETDLIPQRAPDGTVSYIQQITNGHPAQLLHHVDRTVITEWSPSVTKEADNWRSALEETIELASSSGKPVEIPGGGLWNQQLRVLEEMSREGKLEWSPRDRAYRPVPKGQKGIGPQFTPEALDDYVASHPGLDDWRAVAAAFEDKQRRVIAAETAVEKAAFVRRRQDLNETADFPRDEAIGGNAITRDSLLGGSPGRGLKPKPSTTPDYSALTADEDKAVMGLMEGKAGKLSPSMTQALPGPDRGLQGKLTKTAEKASGKTQKIDKLFGVFDPEAGRVLDEALHGKDMGNVARGIFTAAPSLGVTRGTPYDISKDVASAAHAISVARATGKPISAVVSGVRSDIARMLAAAWDHDDAPEAIAQSLKTYGEQVKGLRPEYLGRYQGSVTPDRLIARIVDPQGSSLARVSLERSARTQPIQVLTEAVDGLRERLEARGLPGFFQAVSRMAAPSPAAPGNADILGRTDTRTMAAMAGAGLAGLIGGPMLNELLEDEELPNGGLILGGILAGGLMLGMAASGGALGPIVSDVVRTARRMDGESFLRAVDEDASLTGSLLERTKAYILKGNKGFTPEEADIAARALVRQAGMTQDGAPLVRAARAEGRTEAQARKEIRYADATEGRNVVEDQLQKMADDANGGLPASPPHAPTVPPPGAIDPTGYIPKVIDDMETIYPQWADSTYLRHITPVSGELERLGEGQRVVSGMRFAERDKRILEHAMLGNKGPKSAELGMPADVPTFADIIKLVPPRWRKDVALSYFDRDAPPGFKLDDLLPAKEAAAVRNSPEMQKAKEMWQRLKDWEADATNLTPDKRIAQGYVRHMVDHARTMKQLPEDIKKLRAAGHNDHADALVEFHDNLKKQGMGVRYSKDIKVPSSLYYAAHRHRTGLAQYLIRDLETYAQIFASQAARKITMDRVLPQIRDDLLSLGVGVKEHAHDLRIRASQMEADASAFFKSGDKAMSKALNKKAKEMHAKATELKAKADGGIFTATKADTGEKVYISQGMRKLIDAWVQNAMGGAGERMGDEWFKRLSGDSLAGVNEDERNALSDLFQIMNYKIFIDGNPGYVANRLQGPYSGIAYLGEKPYTLGAKARMSRGLKPNPKVQELIDELGLDVLDTKPFIEQERAMARLPKLLSKVVGFKLFSRTELGVHLDIGVGRMMQAEALANWMKGLAPKGKAYSSDDLVRLAQKSKGKKGWFFVNDNNRPELEQLQSAAKAIVNGDVKRWTHDQAQEAIYQTAFNYSKLERPLAEIEKPRSVIKHFFTFQPYFMKQTNLMWNRLNKAGKMRLATYPMLVGGPKAIPLLGMLAAMPFVNKYLSRAEEGEYGAVPRFIARFNMLHLGAKALGVTGLSTPSNFNPLGKFMPRFLASPDYEFNRANTAIGQAVVGMSPLFGGPGAQALANAAVPAAEYGMYNPKAIWPKFVQGLKGIGPQGAALGFVDKHIRPENAREWTQMVAAGFGLRDQSVEQQRLRADIFNAMKGDDKLAKQVEFDLNAYVNPEMSPVDAEIADALGMPPRDLVASVVGTSEWRYQPDVAALRMIRPSAENLKRVAPEWRAAASRADKGSAKDQRFIERGTPLIFEKLRDAMALTKPGTPEYQWLNDAYLNMEKEMAKRGIEPLKYSPPNMKPTTHEADIVTLAGRVPARITSEKEAMEWAMANVSGSASHKNELRLLIEAHSKRYGLLKTRENLSK